MADQLSQRLAAVEDRLSRVERMLSIDAENLTETNGGPTMNKPVTTVRISQGGTTADGPLRRAEELFESLLGVRNLVSYSEAYRQVIGPYSGDWRNAQHASAIIAVACETASRRVGPLTVRLDALIVGRVTRRPGRGHFAGAAYSEADWIRTFGTWPLLG